MTDRNYIDMLTYMRPEGSKYQRKFCNRYLMPVFGQPDKHGNYTHIVGDKPRVAFMAHHDTVHSKTGRQTVTIDGDYAKATTDCLGADCTSGIYIMLCMIEAGIEGVYVVHAAEEVGCVGSKGLVSDFPAWIDHVDAAISFDRKGYDSIITHQMGLRSCSDEFATSLSGILELGMNLDPTGSYTDSNEYVMDIAECTNISVGYFNQHTGQETQDLVFLETLIDSLLNADWSKLVISRKAGDTEYAMGKKEKWSSKYWRNDDPWDNLPYCNDDLDIKSIIRSNPDAIVTILQSHGYTADSLIDEITDLGSTFKNPYYGYN